MNTQVMETLLNASISLKIYSNFNRSLAGNPYPMFQGSTKILESPDTEF